MDGELPVLTRQWGNIGQTTKIPPGPHDKKKFLLDMINFLLEHRMLWCVFLKKNKKNDISLIQKLKGSPAKTFQSEKPPTSGKSLFP